MGLHSRIWHYGFVLAMPAALCVVHHVTWFLPRALGRSGADLHMFRAATLALVAVATSALLLNSDTYYRAKTYPLGRGGDTMLTYGAATDSRGPMMDRDGRRGATLAALPEGLMLNYLHRHRPPRRERVRRRRPDGNGRDSP